MKMILEYDDFCDQSPENCIKEIEYLVGLFPSIKISLFTVAAMRGIEIHSKEWIEKVKALIESKNIEICIHGLNHTTEEFKKLNYNQAMNSLKKAMLIFEENKIPFVKVFRGPHWGLSFESVTAIEDLGFTHIYNHQDYRYLFENKQSPCKLVYYNQNLKDPIVNQDLIIAHGHTHNVCQNGIQETLNNVISFIKDKNPLFMFASEV